MVFTHKIMSYDDIIYDLIQCCDGGCKFKNVTYREDNPVYSTNFWRLYKDKESKLWKLFPKGSIWKHPTTNQWRFYFNEDVPKFQFLYDQEKNRLRMINHLEERGITFCKNKAEKLNDDEFFNYYLKKIKEFSQKKWEENNDNI
jgi:hypothetical protein